MFFLKEKPTSPKIYLPRANPKNSMFKRPFLQKRKRKNISNFLKKKSIPPKIYLLRTNPKEIPRSKVAIPTKRK